MTNDDVRAILRHMRNLSSKWSAICRNRATSRFIKGDYEYYVREKKEVLGRAADEFELYETWIVAMAEELLELKSDDRQQD